MVVVAAAVVADRTSLVVRNRLEVLEDLLDRLVVPFGALEGGVHLVDVRLVMLVVVQVHGRVVDVRLERGVVVGERWN